VTPKAPSSVELNAGSKFVQHLYSNYPGRIPVPVGGSMTGTVYPFVMYDGAEALGCIGCAWHDGLRESEVQVYHFSAFLPRRGHGTRMMERLCALADQFDVALTLMPQPRWTESDEPLDEVALREWYKKFGFTGLGYMTRMDQLVP
jgi:hypothetical protein